MLEWRQLESAGVSLDLDRESLKKVTGDGEVVELESLRELAKATGSSTAGSA